MTNYSSLANLSVVHHQQLMTPRSDIDTEEARLDLLWALSEEQESLARLAEKPNCSETKDYARLVNGAVLTCTKAFFKAKEKDNSFVPTFRIV
jgi:hypothetical protein